MQQTIMIGGGATWVIAKPEGMRKRLRLGSYACPVELRNGAIVHAETGLPVPGFVRFCRDADLIGVQRHLKVIGIFARLNHRDAKPKYLADVPRFFAYLDGVLPKYPEFAPLQRFIEAKVKPAMAAQS